MPALLSIQVLLLVATAFAGAEETSCFHSDASYVLCSSTGGNVIAASKPFREVDLAHECQQHFLETVFNRSCSRHSAVSTVKQQQPPTFVQRYVYGFLAVCIISALSLIGLLALPILYKVSFKYVLNLFTAIAIGTLFGDAMFHLIPLALGLHSHGVNDHHEHDHHHDHSLLNVPDYQWKILLAVFTLYLFYLLEVLLHWLAHYKHDHVATHSHAHAHSHRNDEACRYSRVHVDADIEHSHLHHNRAHHNLHQHLHTPSIYSNAKSHVNNTSVPCTPCVHSHDGHLTLNPFAEDHDEQSSITTKAYTSQLSAEFDTINPVLRQLAAVKSTGWMVLFGDGIHNFADGLAIGAAFSQGVLSGVATTIAVACHEIPHELGDYAVLLQAGFSHRRALLWNLLSGSTAILGFLLSAAMSDSTNTQKWIFAAIVGMFLYIALVDLLPTLLTDGESDVKRFLVVNVGFLCGVMTMFFLALLEGPINHLATNIK